MAIASELDKIKCSPIKERLTTFCRLFESTHSDLDVASSSDEAQAVFSIAAATGKDQLLVATLVIKIEPAARILPPRIVDRALSSDLATLCKSRGFEPTGHFVNYPSTEADCRKRTDLEGCEYLDCRSNITTEAATLRDPKGMLIDLDLVRELDSLLSGTSHRTGIMQFMGVGVLQRKGHIYWPDGQTIIIHPDLQVKIKATIVQVADRMFLPALLYINAVAREPTVMDIKLELQNLPRGVDEAYIQAITRIESQGSRFRELAKKVLSWAVYARRVLSTVTGLYKRGLT